MNCGFPRSLPAKLGVRDQAYLRCQLLPDVEFSDGDCFVQQNLQAFMVGQNYSNGKSRLLSRNWLLWCFQTGITCLGGARSHPATFDASSKFDASSIFCCCFKCKVWWTYDNHVLTDDDLSRRSRKGDCQWVDVWKCDASDVAVEHLKHLTRRILANYDWNMITQQHHNWC